MPLTELGSTQLRTVGQSGDRRIDVEGDLRVNPVVSFRVGVQCKRYSPGNQVTPRQVRELQGALGRKEITVVDDEFLAPFG